VGDTPYAIDYYLFAMLNWLQLFQKTLAPYPNLQSFMKLLSETPEMGRALAREMAAFG
jgi:glutathione S-transferase